MSATWHWPVASRSRSRTGSATGSRRAGSCPRTGTAGSSTPKHTGASWAAGWAWWCSNDSPTRSPTGTPCTPSSAARRSTTTAYARSATPPPASRARSRSSRTALSHAEVSADTIDYIEAHGTATPLGDAVELEALKQAFARTTDRTQFCALGSVKANIGHLDRAAGITGLIKTALALHHAQLPPQIEYREPAPDSDLDHSPFYINTTPSPWPETDHPRRAGVSAFGLGGTNAHVVLEQAPTPTPTPSPPQRRPHELLIVSAKTQTALDQSCTQLADHLRTHPEQPLADVAHTLQVGRTHFNHRRAITAQTHLEAAAELQQPRTSSECSRNRPVAFLFPGVGEHYAGMARELYTGEPRFRVALDHCSELLDFDVAGALGERAESAASENVLRAMLSPGSISEPSPLHRTRLAQPIVFSVEYALARVLIDFGIHPEAMLGYSLGEYVAACVAGVFSLDDAIKLVAARADLIDQLPAGAMLAVQLGAKHLESHLTSSLDIAAVNTPNACVVGGPPDAISALRARLADADIACMPVATSHAFHTRMLSPAADRLTEIARDMNLAPPRVPYISNVTGTWVTSSQATDPGYWAEHMCRAVQFAGGVEALSKNEDIALVELGPGQGLGAFVKQHPACGATQRECFTRTMPSAHERIGSNVTLLHGIGRLWSAGVEVDWTGVNGDPERARIALPTYPFERQRYWIEAAVPEARQLARPQTPSKKSDIDEWFYRPQWEEAEPLPVVRLAAAGWSSVTDGESARHSHPSSSLLASTWSLSTPESGLRGSDQAASPSAAVNQATTRRCSSSSEPTAVTSREWRTSGRSTAPSTWPGPTDSRKARNEASTVCWRSRGPWGAG